MAFRTHKIISLLLIISSFSLLWHIKVSSAHTSIMLNAWLHEIFIISLSFIIHSRTRESRFLHKTLKLLFISWRLCIIHRQSAISEEIHFFCIVSADFCKKLFLLTIFFNVSVKIIETVFSVKELSHRKCYGM